MTVIVIYESMFGNTRRVAESIADGISSPSAVTCESVASINADLLPAADLVVIGAPTDAWSLSRPLTRKTAADQTTRRSGLQLETNAQRGGVREWLESEPYLPLRVAIFDTRRNVPFVFSGHAYCEIVKLLIDRDIDLVDAPNSFFVDSGNHLMPGEVERARSWGHYLAGALQRV